MSFSAEWQARFAGGGSHSIWPWSDLVGLIMRRVDRARPPRVLELGCGVGANVPLFLGIGADYYAVEGSLAAVEVFRERFPDLGDRISNADFTESLHFAGPFDFIVDRSAVTHNSGEAIERTLNLAYAVLRSGGRYVGVDWFSARHVHAGEGEIQGDPHTRAFKTGHFSGVGKVHFSDESHLRDLFSRYAIEFLEEKCYDIREPQPPKLHATWNVVARKD
ncbi:MAG: hypothetical protein NVS9B12_01060 [Vulcanimicrobiaceae bacterium]